MGTWRAPAMGSARRVRLFLVTITGCLPLLADVTLTPEGHGCCLTVLVQNAEGTFANLNGEYRLKVDEVDKPDPNCVDGCVYARSGDSDDEYCFARSAEAGASVLPSSCPALSTHIAGLN